MTSRIRNAALERDDPFYEGILDQAGYLVCEYTGAMRNVVPFALDDPVTTDSGDGSPSIARADAALDAAPDAALVEAF